MNATVWVEHCT